MDIKEVVYMAATLDCEGWIGIRRMKGYHYPLAIISQKDKGWLDRFKLIWGGLVIPHTKKENKRWAKSWHIEFKCEDLEFLLESVSLELRLKREQAALCLELRDRIKNNTGRIFPGGRNNIGGYFTEEEKEYRKRLWERCHLLNRKGPRKEQLKLEVVNV